MNRKEHTKDRLYLFLQEVIGAPQRLYKDLLQQVGPVREEEELTLYPITTWETLQRIPFMERRYGTAPLIPKVVTRNGTSAVFAQTIETIEQDTYGAIGVRPLVAALHTVDALELGLWCFGKNIMPLSAEKNNALTTTLAEKYAIDSLLLRIDALDLLPELFSKVPLSTLTHVTLVCDANADRARSAFDSYTGTFHVTLAPREMGTIASSCPHSPRDATVFHAEDGTLLEIDGTVRATKMVLLPTPFVRYDTGIRASLLPQLHCSCNKPGFVLL